MRNVDAPKRLPKFSGYPIRERTARKKPRRAKKRLLPTVIFASVFVGTCFFLYSFALPNVASSTPFNGGGVTDAGTRLNEVEAKVATSENKISATGIGRIGENTAQGKLLGRRAALTDARRKLLAQRQKLLGDPRFQSFHSTTTLSGFLTGTQRITNEGTKGGIYFVEVEMHLDDLLHSKFDEDRFAGELDDL